jgi:hypothetical protein
MIDILAQNIRGKVKEEVSDSKMFSVMADTTPDTSNKDRLAVAVRYVKEDSPSFAVKERLIEVKETTDKTGNGQASDILTSLDDSGSKSLNWFSSPMISLQICLEYTMVRRQKLKRNWIEKFHTFLARLIDAILWLNTHVKVAISSRNCSISYRSSMFFSQEAQSVTLS